MPGVFISYRRADSKDRTGKLADHLNMRFGDTLVYYDLDDIKAATEWMKEIREALAKADRVFSAIRQEGQWRMAGAFNGAGSVSAVSGIYEDALAYIDRALALVPEYGAALEDRKTVLSRMNR
jgi:hypothetical protein